METFNELCLLVASYHLFIFTDFVPDSDIHYQAGWSLIAQTVLNIAGNVIVLMRENYLQLKALAILACKKLRGLRKV